MKRALSLVLVPGVAFLLGHFLRAPIPLAIPLAGAMGGGAGTPSGNGDVNGDGILDIADAVYIINHQFYGGTAPVPILCPPTVLPAAGQTKCYSVGGVEIDCASADFPGQDGFYLGSSGLHAPVVLPGAISASAGAAFTPLRLRTPSRGQHSTQEVAPAVPRPLVPSPLAEVLSRGHAKGSAGPGDCGSRHFLSAYSSSTKRRAKSITQTM
jgi:hypothetical protein